MAIKDLGGRVQSEQTKEEILRLLRSEFNNLNEAERQAVLLCLRELDDPAFNELEERGEQVPTRIYDALKDAEFIRKPVDIETFVRDPYFLGKTCDVLYPKLLEDMKELFNGSYREAIFSGSIGWGKCAVKSRTYVSDCITGEYRKIEEFEGREALVPSLDGNHVLPAQCSKVWPSGRKECVRLELESGQWFEASLDHPVLTQRGFVEIGKLDGADLVAAARSIPEPKEPLKISDEEVLAIAYLIADGGMTHGHCVYTKGDDRIFEDFKRVVQKVPAFDRFGAESFRNGAHRVYVCGMTDWVRNLGLDSLSKEKRVPPKLFGLANDQLALLLNRLFTDGNVYVGTPRKIELTLASEGLIDDIQYLLRRFGICARKSYTPKTIKKNGATVEFDAWRLQIADAPTQLAFLEKIGPIFGNERACDALRKQASEVRSNPNWDIVPITTRELKVIRQETGPHTNKTWSAAGTSLADGSHMGRDKFRRMCDALKYQGRYRKFADMDVVWEKVASITPIGVQEVYDLTVPGTENVVANGIVVHNSFFASICACRILYELSCMRDPHKSFGIGKGTDITMVVLSVKEDLAIKVAFENIANKIKESEYFKEHFPFKPLKKEILFPNKIQVAARASTDSAALGLNVFAAFIDESNFMMPMKKKGSVEARVGGQDRAQFLYDQLIRRMKSRFQRHGKLPGMMIVVSSKQTIEDFTAKRIKDSRADPTVFVRDYATWHVKPEGVFSKEMFQVLVGNELVPSKILDPEEVEITRAKLQDGMVIIDVPVDYKQDFINNLEDSIRDIAGVATVSISPFIQQRDKILPCIDKNRRHPFTVTEWVQTESGKFDWNRLAKQVEVREGAEIIREWQPLYYPGLPRHIHIDPSLNSDATGFAMGCVTGYRTVVRRDLETQEQYTERAPDIHIDFMLRIVPPVGGEIDYGLIRSLVYQLQAKGFFISLVTMDQFNSADTLQKFARKGLTAERLSVDKPMDAYDIMKTTIYENRISFYEYEPLLEELKTIQKDNVRNKVDHPPNKSKDVSDAVTGVVFSLTTMYHGAPMGVQKGISQHADPVVDEQRDAVEEDVVFMPFLQG